MNTHYTVNHALIAVLIQLLTALILLLLVPFSVGIVTGGITGSTFYTLRELYQYFYQQKRHKGRFDWEGMISPILATSVLSLLIHLIK